MRRILKTKEVFRWCLRTCHCGPDMGEQFLRKEGKAILLRGGVFLDTFAVSHPCNTGGVAQSHPCFWRPPTVQQSWLVFPYSTSALASSPQQAARAGQLHKSHVLNQAS